MQDRPSPVELLEAVAAFLREQVMPASNGTLAFHARVAANALDIARRELLSDAQAQASTDELASLRTLLGERSGGNQSNTNNGSGNNRDSGSADLETLNRALCQRISNGELTLATPGLAGHLWRITRDKLAVDQPGYGTYRRSLEHHNVPDPHRAPDASPKGSPSP